MKGGENATYRTTLFGFLVRLLMNIYLCDPPMQRNTHRYDLDCTVISAFCSGGYSLVLEN